MNDATLLTASLTTEDSFSFQCSAAEACQLLREKDAIIESLFSQLKKLEEENLFLRKENSMLSKKNRRLNTVINTYRHMLFGRSSEKSFEVSSENIAADDKAPTLKPENNNLLKPDNNNLKRRRGAQPGHKGHGRKIPEELPVIRKIIRVPEEERYCPVCGKECVAVPFTENSNEIDIELKLFRVEYVRERVKRSCNCDASFRFVTAPPKPHAIPKSKCSHNLLAFLIVLKYLFSIPLARVLAILGLEKEALCAGSITGTFRKLLDLLEPLYQSLAEVSRSERRWNIDETGWMSFIRWPEKKGFLSWMWVFVSTKVVFYVWDPSRASSVPLSHLGKQAKGIITADRYRAYIKLARAVPGLMLSFCWAHFRRDFIRAAKADSTLEPWTETWKKRIAEIYRLNKERLESKDSAAQEKLEEAIKKIKTAILTELEDPKLTSKQRQILQKAQKYWEGLTVFVYQPDVPMDNNCAERALRLIALGRKNYYGSHASWSGTFAAVCLTILKTAALNGLNPQAYLRYYLDACAKAQGVPEDLERFLPWNIPQEALKGEQI